MLTKRVKYALKALIFLAKNQEILISAKTISEQEKIPLKFLEQILRELKMNKILKSERGADGGYALLKTPEEINVTQIIRIIDGPVAMLPCASVNFYEKCEDCTDEEHCSIRKLLVCARDTVLPILNTSIEEMSKT